LLTHIYRAHLVPEIDSVHATVGWSPLGF